VDNRKLGPADQALIDNADRLTGIEWKKGANTLASVDYTLDAVGNRTQRVDGLGTHTYEYDRLYRITNADYPGADETDYTYDAADRLTSVTPPGQSAVSYGWDDNGNLTSRGSDHLDWNCTIGSWCLETKSESSCSRLTR
jgi:YD repeat-containing protein